jgi:hypothetical protein
MSRVCALLSWFDESPIWLAACIASLAGVVDHLVAVDGAYALYPQARASSPVDQLEAVCETAAAARVGLTLHVPDAPWAGNEIEKRNATVRLAQAAGCVGDDWWLMVVDADLVVIAESGGLRTALASTFCDVAEYHVITRDDPFADEAVAHAARTGLWQKRSGQGVRGLYRSVPSLRYEGSHYIVRNDHGFLWGNANFQDFLPAADVQMEITFDHRSRLRDLERREQQKAYYRVRDALGVESLEVVA